MKYTESRMSWERLLSSKRFGLERYHEERRHSRSDFQRDYDRLVFSAPFRRLQNKTQVFPLPGSVFVHNRLTHSLEVSCVGRSLGNNVSSVLFEKYANEPWPGNYTVSELLSLPPVWLMIWATRLSDIPEKELSLLIFQRETASA